MATLRAAMRNAIVLKDASEVANLDLVPMPPSRRLWGWQSFAGLWAMSGLCFGAWTAASSLLSLGLNIPHSIGVIIIANLIVTVLATICGQIGADWHIGYTMTQRVVFGNRIGAILTVLVRIILSIVWFASDAWSGGYFISCLLSSLSHNYLTMENHIPASVKMTQRDLIGFVLYQVISAFLFFIKPEKLGRHLVACSAVTFFVSFGIVVWAVVDAGNNGPLVHSKMDLSSSELGWAWLNGISSFYGSMAAGIANQNDYARFARTPKSPIWSVHLAFNVCGLIIPVMGIIAYSAMLGKYNVELWMPNEIINFWMEQNYSAKLRAGAFFASLSFAYSQLIYNAVGNAYGGGMDLSGLFPKVLNIKRGCFVTMLLSWVVQPWLMYNTASNFQTVMSAFSVFITPLIGILICDYWLVRDRKIKLKDLYDLTPGTAYHYTYQTNFRAVIAWILGLVWAVPGLAAAANPSIQISTAWENLYYLNWITGFVISFVLYYAFCKAFPISHLGEIDDADYLNTFSPEECEKLGIAPFSPDLLEKEKNEELNLAVMASHPELETEITKDGVVVRTTLEKVSINSSV